jgi:putative CRISPR-associated protein (TIGR02619 family)
MRYFFITVGTSALYNADVGKGLGAARLDQLRGRLRAFKGDPRNYPDRGTLLKLLVEAHQCYWNQPKVDRIPANFLQTSAELTSSVPIVEEKRPQLTILLASATEEGEFAAQVNLAILRKRFPKLQFECCRVEGLDVEKNFPDVYSALERTVRRYWSDESDRVAVNVTGGYKAALLFVSALAIRYGWDLYYQHESLHSIVEVNLNEARFELLSTS